MAIPMDCETAGFLIEAFHDDELTPRDAAALLGHLSRCPPCEARHRVAGALKAACKKLGPALAQRPARRRSVFSSGFFVPAALVAFGVGCGLLGGHAYTRGKTAMRTTVREVEGEVFCLRCAMEALIPATSFAGSGHRPMLRTPDGRLLTVLQGRTRLDAPKGCSGRRVRVLGRIQEEPPSIEVLELRSARPFVAALGSDPSGRHSSNAAAESRPGPSALAAR